MTLPTPAIGPDDLSDLLSRLPGPRGRLYGHEEMASVEATLRSRFGTSGWVVTDQDFSPQRAMRAMGRSSGSAWQGIKGRNLIATRAGSSLSRVTTLVLAHYDTVPGSPGANDNSASLVAMLAVSDLLAASAHANEVALVATDLEEAGLLGAYSLLEMIPEENALRLVINLDTFAFMDSTPGSQRIPDGRGVLDADQERWLSQHGYAGDFLVVLCNSIARRDATRLAELLEAASPIGRKALVVPVEDGTTSGVDVDGVGRYFLRGDHVPFWRRGLPALHLTDTAELRSPHYHRSTDVPETVNIGVIGEVVAALGAYVAGTAADQVGPCGSTS